VLIAIKETNSGLGYVGGQPVAAGVAPSAETVIAVQRELAQLGYYHGQVDGLVGPPTEGAIRWFQSVDKNPVTGQIDEPTLRTLRISCGGRRVATRQGHQCAET